MPTIVNEFVCCAYSTSVGARFPSIFIILAWFTDSPVEEVPVIQEEPEVPPILLDY
jgi:hypothetical protein